VAWTKTFVGTVVLKSFFTTGISPQNAGVMFKHFTIKKPTTDGSHMIQPDESRELLWLKAKSLLHSVTKDPRSYKAQALKQHLHSLHVQNQPLQHKLDGSPEALGEKEKGKDKKKGLLLCACDIDRAGRGAKWWSASSKRKADGRDAAFETFQLHQEAAKATNREI
jgi:hypothetical protein